MIIHIIVINDIIVITCYREALDHEVKLAELVKLDPLVTEDLLELMDPKDLRVMPDHEVLLELKVSPDQLENLLVVIVTVKLQITSYHRDHLEPLEHKVWMENQEQRFADYVIHQIDHVIKQYTS